MFSIFSTTHFLSFLTAIILVLIAGPFMIPILRKLKFGQNVRDDGPQSHLKKAGTPTMGGIMILIPIILISIFLQFTGRFPQLMPMMMVTLAFGFIGFLDDMLKIIRKSQNGLRAYQKMFLILTVSSAFVIYLMSTLKNFEINIFGFDLTFGQRWIYAIIVILIFALITNAVNLTDGLDGLASGVTMIVMLFFVLLAMTRNDWDSIKVFSSIVSGGCLGFLGFNMHPARVFMGDTGSLALGGAVAAVSVMSGMPLIIFVAGAVYVIEALSVIIQVAYFKKTRKRVFKMAPIHHHFELSGWKEIKVVLVFWAATFAFCALGVIAFMFGIFE